MELYIIRHGETDFNRKGIVQGRGVNSDLNEQGILQAKQFYKAYHHVPFDQIITSTLKRTHQTVQGFIEKGIPWEQMSGLDELDWGVHEGRPSSPSTRQAFFDLTKRWMNGELHHKFEGGESPIEVNMRQKEALKSILSLPHSKVLICMHGRALRLLLCELTKKPLSMMDTFPHSNVSLYRLKYLGSDQFDLLDFNNTDHFNV